MATRIQTAGENGTIPHAIENGKRWRCTNANSHTEHTGIRVTPIANGGNTGSAPRTEHEFHGAGQNCACGTRTRGISEGHCRAHRGTQ